MNHKHLKAFSLIEVLLTTFLVGLFITVLITLQNFLDKNQTTLTVNTQTYNEAAISVESVIREIRKAEHAADGSFPIEIADDQQIIFYTNLDTDIFPERIRYFVDNNQLKRGLTQPEGSPVTYNTADEQITLVIPYLTNTTTPVFTYYNGDWPADTDNNPLPAPARLTDTKMVKVTITINPNPMRPESDYTLESSAQIRNLKTNL